MLPTVHATQFLGPTSSGKTKPAWLICANDAADDIEVIAKVSAGCERTEVALAMEVIAALLGRDLGLPVPQPYAVEISDAFLQVVSDIGFRSLAAASPRVAFGSRVAGTQFAIFSQDTLLSQDQLNTALEIFFFDAVIQNVDRRPENANCLVRGEDFAIFDHELAFSHRLLFGWKPPWEIGGLQHLAQPGMHIFSNALRGKNLDFTALRAKWISLSDEQIEGYAVGLPKEWTGVEADVNAALTLIKEVRDRFDACADEVQRVLR